VLLKPDKCSQPSQHHTLPVYVNAQKTHPDARKAQFFTATPPVGGASCTNISRRSSLARFRRTRRQLLAPAPDDVVIVDASEWVRVLSRSERRTPWSSPAWRAKADRGEVGRECVRGRGELDGVEYARVDMVAR
jgi:hypothetical protein